MKNHKNRFVPFLLIMATLSGVATSASALAEDHPAELLALSGSAVGATVGVGSTAALQPQLDAATKRISFESELIAGYRKNIQLFQNEIKEIRNKKHLSEMDRKRTASLTQLIELSQTRIKDFKRGLKAPKNVVRGSRGLTVLAAGSVTVLTGELATSAQLGSKTSDLMSKPLAPIRLVSDDVIESVSAKLK